MSNLGFLLQKYSQSPAVKSLTGALQGASAVRVQLQGLNGAQDSFVVASVVTHLKNRFHLLIAPDKDTAAYLQNDLEGILENLSVHFFPDSFKRPAFFDDLNPTQVLQRSETVSKITAPKSASDADAAQVVVTYPQALFEKVVSPKVLAEHRIEVAVGEKLDVDFMISVLVEYGFERADFVYEPGQFSIRGGIVDLFSYGNELPYRIELFDDEVETIRIFDPLTQLSQRNVSRLSIVPNLHTRFRQEQKISLLQILPADTVVWVRDFQTLCDHLQSCFERAEAFAQKLTALDTAELREIFRDRAFLYPGEVIEDLRERPIVFVNDKIEVLQKNHPTLFA